MAFRVSTTAYRPWLLALFLLGSTENGKSQLIEVARYREVTPYQVEDLGKANWEGSGRPGIFASEFIVPANTFLRTVTLEMAASPHPRGGFQLHLFRIRKQGEGQRLSHVAKLAGPANPASAGSHAYRIPSGLALSGHYLLVAAVSPGGGTYRWVIEPGTTNAPKRVYFGLLANTLVDWAGGNANSGSTGGSSSGSIAITSGATLSLGSNSSTGSHGSFVTIPQNPGNHAGGLVLITGGSTVSTFGSGALTLSNPISNPVNTSPTIGGSTGLTNNGSLFQTILSISPPTIGQFSTLNLLALPPQGSQQVVTPVQMLPINPSNLPLLYVSVSDAGAISLSNPTPPEEAPVEREASAFLSSSSGVAAAEEADSLDLGRTLLFVDPEESGQFSFTLEQGLARALVAVRGPKPFSPVPVGSDGPTQRIRILNLAEASIGRLSIQAIGETRRHFKITQVPRRTLDPGESTEFSITPRPRRAGNLRGLIEIRTSAGSEFVSVSVRGVENSFTPRLVGKGG